MAKRKKQASQEPAPPSTRKRNALVPMEGSYIQFKPWFINKLGMDRRIKPHHFEQLKLFVAGLGCNPDEDLIDRYESCLRSYFGE